MNACIFERVMIMLVFMLRIFLDIPLGLGILLMFWLSERVLYCHQNFSPIGIGAVILMRGNTYIGLFSILKKVKVLMPKSNMLILMLM